MELVEKSAIKVIGVRIIATWDDLFVEMHNAWKAFLPRHTEIPERVSDVFLGATLSKENDEYTQLIGVEVSDIDEVPDGMIAVEIPSQRCVHHQHVGPGTGIAASYGKIYKWADREGYAVDEFKLDVGYTEAGTEEAHDLFVRVVSS